MNNQVSQKLGEIHIFFDENSRECDNGFPTAKNGVRVYQVFKFIDTKPTFLFGWSTSTYTEKPFKEDCTEDETEELIRTFGLDQKQIIQITDKTGFDFDKLTNN